MLALPLASRTVPRSPDRGSTSPGRGLPRGSLVPPYSPSRPILVPTKIDSYAFQAPFHLVGQPERIALTLASVDSRQLRKLATASDAHQCALVVGDMGSSGSFLRIQFYIEEELPQTALPGGIRYAAARSFRVHTDTGEIIAMGVDRSGRGDEDLVRANIPPGTYDAQLWCLDRGSVRAAERSAAEARLGKGATRIAVFLEHAKIGLGLVGWGSALLAVVATLLGLSRWILGISMGIMALSLLLWIILDFLRLTRRYYQACSEARAAELPDALFLFTRVV